MAKVIGNDVTIGLSGKFGKLFVFRVVRGKTYACHAPSKPDKRKETAAQRHTRTTFREATHWAKVCMLNPEKKKFYKELAKAWDLTNAYTAAIKDFMLNHGVKELGPASKSEQNTQAVEEYAQATANPNVLKASNGMDKGGLLHADIQKARRELSPEEKICRLPALLIPRLGPDYRGETRLAQWTGGYSVLGITRAFHQPRSDVRSISDFKISHSSS